MIRMMKVLLIANTIFFTHLALAADSIDRCKNIEGIWEGAGYADFTFGKCNYGGEGTIKKVDDRGNIAFDINLKKVSGSGVDNVCYAFLPLEGHGTCKNNQLEFLLNGIRYSSKIDENMSLTAENHIKIMKTIPAYIKATLTKKP